MPPLRYDAFIANLKELKTKYPEFSQALQMLIQQLQEEKLKIIQKNIKNMNREDW